MNWNRIEGKWKQLTDFVQERWGKLTAKTESRNAGRPVRIAVDEVVWSFEKRNTMFQILTEITRWIAIPTLLFASMFSYFAMKYEPWLTGAVMLAAIIFIALAIRARQYFWAVGLVAVIVAFSPLILAAKIFLIMGLTCMAALAAVVAGFRTQPLPVV
jgi:hypothetical protein